LLPVVAIAICAHATNRELANADVAIDVNMTESIEAIGSWVRVLVLVLVLVLMLVLVLVPVLVLVLALRL